MPLHVCLSTPQRASRTHAPSAAAWWRGVFLALLVASGALAAQPGFGAAARADGLAVPAEAAQSAAAAALQPTELEVALVAQVNAARAAHGLAPVALDLAALGVARARAADQVPLPKLAHTDAAGDLVFVRLLDEARLGYSLAGENLARLVGPAATAAERAHQALMDSPMHRANVLEPSFDRLAVGAATSPSGQIIFAQIFRDAS